MAVDTPRSPSGGDPDASPLAYDDAVFDERSVGPSRRLLGFLLTVTALALAFVSDLLSPGPLLPHWTPILGRVDVSGLDWLYLLAVVLAVFWVVVPLAADRRRTRHYWARLRTDPVALAALGFLGGFLVIGLLAPVLLDGPAVRPLASYQPPVGVGVDARLTSGCVGSVVDGRCYGTWAHPLGTTFNGNDVLTVTALGTWTAVRVVAVTATIIVPLAVIVGLTAGYLGGRVDELLMGLSDVVGTIPPFVTYVIARFVVGPGDLLLLVGAFALTGWAGVARAVRNDVLTQREALYVQASRNVGGSSLWIARRHVLPNLSGTVASTTAQQVATLLLAEAALSFIDFGAPAIVSWGTVIRQGAPGTFTGSILEIWWISLVPVVALAATIVAISVLGDALQDVLSPHD